MNTLGSDFVPLSVRRGKREPFRLHEGIPVHMQGLVSEWFDDALSANSQEETVNVRWAVNLLQLPYDVATVHDLLTDLDREIDMKLDLMDMLVQRLRRTRVGLARILDTGGSAWRVDEGGLGLLRRVPDEAQAAYERALSREDLSSEHLGDAWRHAFGRSQDAGDAWHDAIRAVEAALHPIVTPESTKSTWGSIRGDLRKAPEGKFVVRAPGDDPMKNLLMMLDCLMYEDGRHGSDERVPSIETARIAVLQATAIVAAVGEGLIERA